MVLKNPQPSNRRLSNPSSWERTFSRKHNQVFSLCIRLGTGKTGTFTIGSLQRIDPNLRKTQVIILAPVRELAKQIYDVVKGIGQFLNIDAFCCIGGTAIAETKERCRQGVHVIIATPGRLIDMLKNKYLDSAFLKVLVVDEADQMLDQGFVENIAEILKMIPGDV